GGGLLGAPALLGDARLLGALLILEALQLLLLLALLLLARLLSRFLLGLEHGGLVHLLPLRLGLGLELDLRVVRGLRFGSLLLGLESVQLLLELLHALLGGNRVRGEGGRHRGR